MRRREEGIVMFLANPHESWKIPFQWKSPVRGGGEVGLEHLVFHVVEVFTSRMAKKNTAIRGGVIIHNGKASFSIMLHQRITNISWILLVTIHAQCYSWQIHAHPKTNDWRLFISD